MAEEYKAGYPSAPANGYYWSAKRLLAEQPHPSSEAKRKEMVIVWCGFCHFPNRNHRTLLTVMRVRTPNFRVRSATFDAFNVQTTTPSFNLMMNTALGIKNKNFGPYKYETSTINFFYRGTPVGSAQIQNSKASFRSTKKINVEVNLVNQSGNTELGNDLNTGILPLTSQWTLNGKVTLMFIFKKKKAINLDCTMDVNIATKELLNVQCN